MDADFAQALRNTRHPVLVADDDRRYVDANDAALRLLGVTPSELRSYRIDDHFVGPDLDSAWDAFVERGGVTGLDRFRMPSGDEVMMRYGAVAHVAPGRHLCIFNVEPGDDDREDEPTRLLTAREREVVALAAHGNTTRQIAERLVVSPTTVDSHIRSAMERLGARNRVHAVALALARGEVVFAADD